MEYFRNVVLTAGILAVLSSVPGLAGETDYDDGFDLSCTSIVAGKDATTNGSTITSHTCDGHYRTWVRMDAAADFPEGALHNIYKGLLKTSGPEDTVGVKLVARIPEAGHTYRYLNTGYPCLSENAIGIGETTFGGPDTLRNSSSPMMIEELERIALQRCRTAREAVLTMGAIAEEYGYGDGGECLTVADVNEVWFFEIIGVGRKEKGAAWAAVRIPDDHIAVSANIPRIGVVNRSDKKNFLCSDNLERVAKKFGLWDGQQPFSFWRAFHSAYGDGRNYSYREFFILSHLAPSLGLEWGMDELPLSVKPDEKIDVKTVFEMLRSTYEGTPWDVSGNMKCKNRKGETVRSPIANPWITGETVNMLNTIKEGTAVPHRTPSVVWCAYSHVIELDSAKPRGLDAVCWYSVDNPAQSPRIPIFCGSADVPESFKLCGQKIYRPDCALWQFRRANRLALTRWTANKEGFLNDLNAVEGETFRRLDSLNTAWSGAAADLDIFSEEAYSRAAAKWNELEAKYWLTTWKGIL